MINPTRRTCLRWLLIAGIPGTTSAQNKPFPLVGFVSWFSPSQASQVDPLKAGLVELGWQESSNLRLEVHFTAGDAARTRAAVGSLLQRGANVVVVRATNAAHIAKEMTSFTPIVMLVSDPLATGLVKSLARPEGNLTGLSLQGPDQAGKRLEHLRAIMPDLRNVAFLGLADDPNAATFVAETRAAAASLNVRLHVRLVQGLQSYDDTDFRGLAEAGVQALLVQPIFTGQQERIVPLAMRRRIAVVSNYPAFAEGGALLTLGPDDIATTRRAAYYVHRLLQGARPSDLPIEQPSRFTLALNRTSARALGLTIPDSLLMSADRVFD